MLAFDNTIIEGTTRGSIHYQFIANSDTVKFFSFHHRDEIKFWTIIDHLFKHHAQSLFLFHCIDWISVASLLSFSIRKKWIRMIFALMEPWMDDFLFYPTLAVGGWIMRHMHDEPITSPHQMCYSISLPHRVFWSVRLASFFGSIRNISIRHKVHRAIK